MAKIKMNRLPVLTANKAIKNMEKYGTEATESIIKSADMLEDNIQIQDILEQIEKTKTDVDNFYKSAIELKETKEYRDWINQNTNIDFDKVKRLVDSGALVPEEKAYESMLMSKLNFITIAEEYKSITRALSELIIESEKLNEIDKEALKELDKKQMGRFGQNITAMFEIQRDKYPPEDDEDREFLYMDADLNLLLTKTFEIANRRASMYSIMIRSYLWQYDKIKEADEKLENLNEEIEKAKSTYTEISNNLAVIKKEYDDKAIKLDDVTKGLNESTQRLDSAKKEYETVLKQKIDAEASFNGIKLATELQVNMLNQLKAKLLGENSQDKKEIIKEAKVENPEIDKPVENTISHTIAQEDNAKLKGSNIHTFVKKGNKIYMFCHKTEKEQLIKGSGKHATCWHCKKASILKPPSLQIKEKKE